MLLSLSAKTMELLIVPSFSAADEPQVENMLHHKSELQELSRLYRLIHIEPMSNR